MFVGHFAAGLGLKRAAPAVSLGTLFLSVQFLDLLWPTLLLAGVEQVEIRPGAAGPPLAFTHYPISHSLALVLLWSVLFGLAHYGLRRSLRSALVLALAVSSHWILDLIVHYPDLPLAPGTTARFGFSLWASTPISLTLELILFGAGAILYLRATRASDRIGTIGFWLLAALLLGIHLGNIFGPPPPSVTAIAWVGQAQWLLVLAGYWVDRHRTARVMDHSTRPSPGP